MRRATPSTQALLAFTATARHLSFTKAAHELNVTQGAVSRQIASLEAFVRAPLFRRLAPGLALTEAAHAYLPKVEAALHDIEAATLELQAFGGRPNHINVACPPSFASIWLLPRLHAFRAQFAGVTLNLLPPVWSDPMPADVHLAVRHGVGQWPHVDAVYLFGREQVMVCAPKAGRQGARGAAGRESPRSAGNPLAAQLAAATLMHHAQVPDAWPEALTTLGIADRVNGYAGPRFAQYSMLLNAAAAGFGIALVPEVLARSDLAAGRIERFCAADLRSSRGYYACFPSARHANLLHQQVTQWMQMEATRDSA